MTLKQECEQDEKKYNDNKNSFCDELNDRYMSWINQSEIENEKFDPHPTTSMFNATKSN